jgi:hypothetical protein
MPPSDIHTKHFKNSEVADPGNSLPVSKTEMGFFI